MSGTSEVVSATDRRHSGGGPARVVVVIVNFRTPELVIENLRALEAEVRSLGDVGVLIVDNHSADGSLKKIRSSVDREHWADWVTTLASDRNGGFSYGNNLAFRHALNLPSPPNYFHLLNSDARVRPGAIAALRDFLDIHPDVGIAGSSIRTTDDETWPVAFRFPNLLGEFEAGLQSSLVSKIFDRWKLAVVMPQTEPRSIDWVIGASMMVRRQLLERVRLMDDAYFLYFEETDLCLQAYRCGWSCSYVPNSVVVHHFGQSTGFNVNTPALASLPRHWFESRRRYLVKNHGLAYAAVADIVRIIGLVMHHCSRLVRGHKDLNPPHLLADLVRNSVLLNLRRARSDIQRDRCPSRLENLCSGRLHI